MLELLVQSFPCVNKCTAEFRSWHLPFHSEIGSGGWLLSNWGGNGLNMTELECLVSKVMPCSRVLETSRLSGCISGFVSLAKGSRVPFFLPSR